MSPDTDSMFEFVNVDLRNDISRDHARRRVRSHVSKLQHRRVREGRTANTASLLSSEATEKRLAEGSSAPSPCNQQASASDGRTEFAATLFERLPAPMSHPLTYPTDYCSNNARKIAEIRHCALRILDWQPNTILLKEITAKVMSWGTEASSELTPHVGIAASIISKVLALVPSSIMVSTTFLRKSI